MPLNKQRAGSFDHVCRWWTCDWGFILKCKATVPHSCVITVMLPSVKLLASVVILFKNKVLKQERLIFYQLAVHPNVV